MISSTKFSICFALIVWLAAAGTTLAQQTHVHEHPSLKAIDEALKNGSLTVDKSILYKFYVLQAPSKLPEKFQPSQPGVIKCGTPVFAAYERNRDELSAATISEVESMMATFERQASETFVSPSGTFLIHYETTGNNAVPPDDTSGVIGVPDYVEFVAAAADSSWRYQVQQTGFTNPIISTSQYDVAIRDLGAGLYGQTRIVGNTTEIDIHNDFLNGFPPNDHPQGDQIGAINVTMAHEFKHAIQYANNQWQGSAGSVAWSEMDATLMEEVTYDNVNDYYNYIIDSRSIFLDPADPIPGSYFDVSFSIFFDEVFGIQFWVDVWQEIKLNPTTDFLGAISSQVTARGELFAETFAKTHLWHYASGPQNSTPNYGFEERTNYPTPAINVTINGIQQSLQSERFIEANAANYVSINPIGNEADEVLITLSADISQYAVGAIAYFKDGTSDTFLNASVSEAGNIRIETPWSWNNISRIGLVAVNTSSSNGMNIDIGTSSYKADVVTLRQNYPNPFSETTTLEFTLQQDSNVQLKIFDITGRLVRTLIDGPRSAGNYTPSLSSDRLASGVYLYQLITDKRIIVKKLTLIK